MKNVISNFSVLWVAWRLENSHLLGTLCISRITQIMDNAQYDISTKNQPDNRSVYCSGNISDRQPPPRKSTNGRLSDSDSMVHTGHLPGACLFLPGYSPHVCTMTSFICFKYRVFSRLIYLGRPRREHSVVLVLGCTTSCVRSTLTVALCWHSCLFLDAIASSRCLAF